MRVGVLATGEPWNVWNCHTTAPSTCLRAVTQPDDEPVYTLSASITGEVKKASSAPLLLHFHIKLAPPEYTVLVLKANTEPRDKVTNRKLSLLSAGDVVIGAPKLTPQNTAPDRVSTANKKPSAAPPYSVLFHDSTSELEPGPVSGAGCATHRCTTDREEGAV